MLRIAVGLVIGLAVFLGILYAIELAARQIAPGEYSATQLLIVVVGYFASAFAGGLAAAIISRRPWTVWAIVLLAIAGSIWSIIVFPQPLWMQFGALIAPLLGGLAARSAAGRRIPSASSTAAPDA